MIQPAKPRSRRPRRAVPSRIAIDTACRQIRSEWTPAERQRRASARRVDAADPRLRAHLKFVEFLLAQSAELQ